MLLYVEVRYEFHVVQLGFISFADAERYGFCSLPLLHATVFYSMNPVGKTNCIGDIFLGNELSNKTVNKTRVVFLWTSTHHSRIIS